MSDPEGKAGLFKELAFPTFLCSCSFFLFVSFFLSWSLGFLFVLGFCF